ncbi:heterokaryon incompatibility protein het-E-1 [Fusarium mexicanum]|uniref:Heterokaryon incompatibility protein het-E-1 n=1 Tax=Fusarium mexicanum TaxID=751941 RepID=A0A8H5I9D6_9HYPO|nr:heterokaryon incompatibility protein het-E-1 [Fusarium mexicanum]
MATNHQTSFEKSLDLFRRELSDDEIKQINGVNRKNVLDSIKEIQDNLGRRNDLCNFTRDLRFLLTMDRVEKLVTTFFNASDVVAFIWGPIKLALMVATTLRDASRQLTDAYEEMAEALGNLAFFHKLTHSRDLLKLVLEDYFSDILRFHRCVLDVFSRPEWKRVFKWAWGSFRREVKPILEGLKRKQVLLSDDKLQSYGILEEVQDSYQYAKDQFSNLQNSLEYIKSTLASEQLQSKALEAQKMKTYLESRLDFSKSRTDLLLESRDLIVEHSGSWIFTNPIFKYWEEGKSPDGRVLFINGSHGSAERRTARSMLQHLIMQLVNADEIIMRFAYERLSTMESTELADLKKLANYSLTSRPMATLVLDGLNEATDNESEIAINWCLNELLMTARLADCDLKILICGQMDERLNVLLSSHPRIQLDMFEEHLAVHERPFKCPHANCFAYTIGYASPERLENHNEAFHQSVPTAEAVFPVDGLASPISQNNAQTSASSRSWHILDIGMARIYGKALNLLSCLGLREDGVAAPGHHRIRWKNNRGKLLYDDYIEHEAGALQTLEDYLHSLAYSPTNHSTRESGSDPIYPVSAGSFNNYAQANTLGSVDIADEASRSAAYTEGSPFQQDLEVGKLPTSALHVLSGMNSRKHTVILHEELVTHITNDRQLFQALRETYFEHVGKLKCYWSLRTINAIQFMKVFRYQA